MMTAPPNVWKVPVRLLAPLRLSFWRRHRAGARLDLPFGQAMALEAAGRAVVLLPRLNTETGEIRDPSAAPRPKDPHRGLRWW